MPVFVQKMAFLVPFGIGVVITLVILWYMRTRSPIRRYRPPFLQLLLVGIVLLMASAGLATFVANTILTGDDVVKALAEEKKKGYDELRNDTVPNQERNGGKERELNSWDRIKYGPKESEQQNQEFAE